MTIFLNDTLVILYCLAYSVFNDFPFASTNYNGDDVILLTLVCWLTPLFIDRAFRVCIHRRYRMLILLLALVNVYTQCLCVVMYIFDICYL